MLRSPLNPIGYGALVHLSSRLLRDPLRRGLASRWNKSKSNAPQKELQLLIVLRLLFLLSLVSACSLESPPVSLTPEAKSVAGNNATVVPNTAQAGTKKDDFPTRFNEFEYLPNPDGFSRPVDTAKEALERKYGAASSKFVGGVLGSSFRLQSLPFENQFVLTAGTRYAIGDRFYYAPPGIALLLSQERTYFLRPNDYNDFLHLHGKRVEIANDVLFPGEILTFIHLYFDRDERIIFEAGDLGDLAKRYPELGIDAEKVSRIKTLRRGDREFTSGVFRTAEDYQPELVVDFYTSVYRETNTRLGQTDPPMESELVITRYLAALGGKGEVCMQIAERNRYYLPRKYLPGDPPLR